MKERKTEDKLDGLISAAVAEIEEEKADEFAAADTSSVVISDKLGKKITRKIDLFFRYKNESKSSRSTRRTLIALAAAVALAVVLCISVGAIRNGSLLFDLGKSTREAKSGEDRIAATYKDNVIYYSEVMTERAANAIRNEESTARYATDRDIVDRLIEGIIMLEEAKERGMVVTDDEIADFVGSSRYAYELPDGKEMIDDYCAGLNITVEEYFAMLEAEARTVILHQRVKDEVGREYCEKNGIVFTKVNQPKEMIEYIDGYFEQKRLENEDYIVYYVEK